jgi:amino acid adenylation domain-containing protein/thioester reductase-like protein
MTVIELFAELTRKGVQLSANGDELTVQAPKGVLTPLLRAALVENKAEILARLRQSIDGDGARSPIVPAPQDRHLPFPLTDMQQAYWIGRTAAIELGGVACQVYYEMEFAGLDVTRLNRAWQSLIGRHDMLRAIVRPDGQQQILATVPEYRFEILDLRGRETAAATSELECIRQDISHRVTPANEWPLFEIRATQLDSDRIRLHLRIELIIADGWSVGFLLHEWFQLYLEPGPIPQALELSFRDYVLAEIAAQDSEAYRRAEEYWLGRLRTLPPAPDLPLAASPAAIAHPRFVRRSSELDATSWQKLKARGSRAGLTPSGVLCAAFADVLATWSKSPDFTLNLTFFNRPLVHPELKDVIGDFTSIVLLEVHGSEDTFEARAQRLHEQLRRDLEHSAYSGVRVLRQIRALQGSAIAATAPVVFTSGLSIRSVDDSPTFSMGELTYGVSQTPQVWLDHQTFERSGGLFTSWDSVDALFPPGLLDTMFTAYSRLLRRLADDEETWHETIRCLVPVEQLRQREAMNATAAPVAPVLLHQLFASQVPVRPHQAAIVSHDRTLSYGELFRRANVLGHRLREAGASPNTLVAVILAKGWEQVVAVLGILESGAAYLPIDPDLPSDRVSYLLENGQVALSVTSHEIDAMLEWPVHLQRFCVDGDDGAGVLAPLPPAQSPEDLAYVIYTSGSTGLPKGVMIDHRGAVNTIEDINRRFSVGPEDRVLALSALSFDLSVYDIFGTLAAGGTIVIPAPGASRDPSEWRRLISDQRVTIWNSVPALLQMFVEYVSGNDDPPGQPPRKLRRSDEALAKSDGGHEGRLRLVLLSGDWIPLSLPEQARVVLGGAEMISLGGATEASIWSILYPIERVDPAWKSIPYGRPMANQRMHVLNALLERCPVWVPGELYIGGIGLAQGYWRDEEKSRASFFRHPRTGERLYRTGDWGRYQPDGNIEFLGREDFQVKIGGHRIELGEIEETLARHPAVRAGVVVAEGEPQGNRRLVAYVVPRQPQALASVQMLQDFQLPELEGVLLDPMERVEFKRGKPGLRKVVGGAFQVQLNRPPLDEAAINTYSKRRSYRAFLSQPISLQRLSDFLACLWHVNLEGVSFPKAQYGSAGSLYPVQTYLYVKPNRVDGLAAGAYYHHPYDHSLVSIASDAHIDAGVHVPTNRAVYESSAFSIFLIAQLNAIRPMYGEHSQPYAMLEAGLMTQLLEMSAPAHDIGLCQTGGVDGRRVQQLFALDDSHLLLHSLVGGAVDPAFVGVSGLRHEALRPSDVRGFLRAMLPEYMIPSGFVMLDSLPLTPNGKADRKALSARGKASRQTGAPDVAPRTELERTIALLVQETLHLQKVGVHDSFFELGADSVELVHLHRRLAGVLQRELPIAEIFKTPTISALAEYLGHAAAGTLGAPGAAGGIDLSREAVLDPEIVARTPANVATPPAAVFLTGATGFLGGYLLQELLQQTSADIYCLVRARNVEEGQARLVDKLESWLRSRQGFGARIKAVAGDLRQPLFGLSPIEYDRLAGQVDAIYHGGADVNFVRTYDVLKPSTVIGTTEVLRLAARVKTKPVHHVSSLAVFGSPAYLGRRMIYEDDPLADSRGLAVGYFQTKWVAERLVMVARDRGIPACIYRPGQIAGHSATGDCKLTDLLPLMIRGCIQLGLAPSLDSLQLDLMPVDEVSRVIVRLSYSPELLGKSFNLVAPRPLTWDQIFAAIGSSGYTLRRLPYTEWLNALRVASPDNALLQMLPFFEALDERLLKSVPVDSENVRQGLTGAAVSMPEPGRLLRLYLDYFARVDFIPSPPGRHANQGSW